MQIVIAVLLCAVIPAGAKDFPSLKPALADRIAKLEKDLAEKIMRRPDVAAGQVAQLEMQIDLRVIQRWFLNQAAAAAPESDVQVEAMLRATQLAAATAQVEQSLKDDPPAASRTQSESMVRIHQISYELKELKDGAQLDDICKRVGGALLNVLNPAGVDPKSVPLMRPSRVIRPHETHENVLPTTNQSPRTISDLSAEITRAAVSVPLRQQLLTIAKAAGKAASEKGQETEAEALYQMLAGGVDLAKGLAGTTAFSAAARTEIESQLAEGLALFSDPRTRASGQARVEQLHQYRSVMNRISKIKLSTELRNALGPAFAYAQTHVEQGEKLLNAIDDYAVLCEKWEATPRRDNPIANLRKATDDAAHQCDALRQGFLTNAGDLGEGPAAVSPIALEARVADMRSAAELYVILDGMQQTYETLNSYKPRPFGAIEARTQKAAVAATAMVKSPARTEAIKFLGDLNRLARLSDALAQRSLKDIPQPIAASYAGISLSEFETKIRALMADLISQVAAGLEMDKVKLARLNAVGELCDSLRIAAGFEQSLAKAPSLGKWVDWTLTVEELRAMMLPYQQSMAAAFAGFVADTPGAVEKFLQTRATYLPVVALLRRDGEYAEICEAMPGGAPGDLARLITPLHGQPFAAERFVSFAVSAWTLLAPTDPEGAAIALEAAAKRLEANVKFSPRDLIPSTKPSAVTSH